METIYNNLLLIQSGIILGGALVIKMMRPWRRTAEMERSYQSSGWATGRWTLLLILIFMLIGLPKPQNDGWDIPRDKNRQGSLHKLPPSLQKASLKISPGEPEIAAVPTYVLLQEEEKLKAARQMQQALSSSYGRSIYLVKSKNRIQYLLLIGPFVSEEEARAFCKKQVLPFVLLPKTDFAKSYQRISIPRL